MTDDDGDWFILVYKTNLFATSGLEFLDYKSERWMNLFHSGRDVPAIINDAIKR